MGLGRVGDGSGRGYCTPGDLNHSSEVHGDGVELKGREERAVGLHVPNAAGKAGAGRAPASGEWGKEPKEELGR